MRWSGRIGAMRDVELYRALPGLTTPWTVANVDVDLKGQRVVVRVDAGPGPYPCPTCGTPAPRYDSKPRRSRRLDTMQFTTWIEAEMPRVECGTHGVKQIRVPWAEPGSQFTALFERLAIDLRGSLPQGIAFSVHSADIDSFLPASLLLVLFLHQPGN